MRISKKFLGGVFNFNHQDYPSSVALISLSLGSLPQMYWNEGEQRAPGVTARVKVTETKSKCDVWLRLFWELSGRRQDLGPGVKSL